MSEQPPLWAYLIGVLLGAAAYWYLVRPLRRWLLKRIGRLLGIPEDQIDADMRTRF